MKIPVIGNGDVTSPQTAKQLLEETGCDGIMVGRAAQGNPWIFKEISHYLETGELLPRPSKAEVRDMMLRHARMQIEYKGEYIGMREMRKHVSWYTTGLHNCAALRDEVNHTESLQELFSLLDKRMIDK